MKKYSKVIEKTAWVFLEWRRIQQKSLMPYKITIQQYTLMKKLEKNETMSPHEIAILLHCDRPTASVIIKNLSSKGLIETTKSKENAKYKQVSITNEGKSLIEFIKKDKKSIGGHPFDVLTDDELESLNDMLERVKKRVEELREK